jgi:hypothetical protein
MSDSPVRGPVRVRARCLSIADFYRQLGKALARARTGDVGGDDGRAGQSAQSILARDFPGRNRADEDLVIRVGNRLARRVGERQVAGKLPKEHVVSSSRRMV